MDRPAGWLFPNTSLGTILRRRPMAMALFEGSGIDPWKSLDQGLGETLRIHGLGVDEFARALRDLPRPPAESDWRTLPVYHLLDHLAAQHRAFLHDALPALGRVLSEDAGSDGESLQLLDMLSSEWPGFCASLVSHIREEEDHLFLRVLRYHSCLLLGSADADPGDDLVRAFGPVRLLAHGQRDLELVGRFLEKVMPVLPGPRQAPSALEARIRPLLEELHRALLVHADLESRVLLPMATALERALLDRRLQGEGLGQAPAQDAPHPAGREAAGSYR